MDLRAFENLPIVKFEIENLKSQIMAHLGAAGSELGEHIRGEITRAVDTYPWRERVEEVTHSQISQLIDSYFKYGKGAQALRKAVELALEPIVADASEAADIEGKTTG